MSGVFPSTPKPSSVSLASNYPTLSDMTHSGKRNVRQFGAQKWALMLTFPDTLSREQLMPIYAFILKQKGQIGTFTFTPPDLETPRGVATGTPLVDGNQTGDTIVIDGWTPSTTNIMRAGDIIKFASHNKVYMVTEDANSDVVGSATLSIEPPVMQEVVNNEAVTVSGVEFTCMMAGQASEYTVSGPLLYTYSATLLEVV